MEMEIGVWQSIPKEIALNIIARLLPRRSLVRLRTVWKEWNDMLSSYAAMHTMYPNIYLSYTSAFLFQSCSPWHQGEEIQKEVEGESEYFYHAIDGYPKGSIKTWVMEGNGEFYKVSDHSYPIEISRNSFFVLRDFGLLICKEKSRGTSKRIEGPNDFDKYFGIAFDSSTEQFIGMKGPSPEWIEVYDSSCYIWRQRWIGDFHDFWVFGRGVYYRGSFYWLDHVSRNGGVVSCNVSDLQWTKIPAPRDGAYRYSNVTFDNYTYDNFLRGDANPFTSIASKYWVLAGSDIGELILFDKEHSLMWKLENGEENINSKRWCRFDICLPRETMRISVNNSGWIMVVSAEGINVYDGNRRLVRKFGLDEVDPELASVIIELKSSPIKAYNVLSVLPYECTYIWWPWEKKSLT